MLWGGGGGGGRGGGEGVKSQLNKPTPKMTTHSTERRNGRITIQSSLADCLDFPDQIYSVRFLQERYDVNVWVFASTSVHTQDNFG